MLQVLYPMDNTIATPRSTTVVVPTEPKAWSSLYRQENLSICSNTALVVRRWVARPVVTSRLCIIICFLSLKQVLLDPIFILKCMNFWIVFWNDSQRFGFSTRSLGHVMFFKWNAQEAFPAKENITWPRLLVEKPKHRESFQNTIQSELNSLTVFHHLFTRIVSFRTCKS